MIGFRNSGPQPFCLMKSSREKDLNRLIAYIPKLFSFSCVRVLNGWIVVDDFLFVCLRGFENGFKFTIESGRWRCCWFQREIFLLFYLNRTSVGSAGIYLNLSVHFCNWTPSKRLGRFWWYFVAVPTDMRLV